MELITKKLKIYLEISRKMTPSLLKNVVKGILYKLHFWIAGGFYYGFQYLPKQDKVVATTFRGRKYGDNPQYIIETLHKMNPDVEIIWLNNKQYDYDVPDFVRKVPFYNLVQKAYEYSTAKVWINTHRMESNIRKSSDQLFIETWHGGLGIKKIEGDVPTVMKRKWEVQEIKNTSRMADLFISNSDHLTRIYRNAFNYRGVIWKSGYPKNDILFSSPDEYQEKIHKYFGIDLGVKILVYAPTFRDYFDKTGFLEKPYAIDFQRVITALSEYDKNQWVILIRWHPIMAKKMKQRARSYSNGVIDATDYPEMQELILAADAFISDYSSCIFDAAIREIPCFTFATDFEEYRIDRGVYYEIEELPFPYAHNNDELARNIETFNYEKYIQDWNDFKKKIGLYETGHAARDIAYVINEYIKGNKKPLDEIKSE